MPIEPERLLWTHPNHSQVRACHPSGEPPSFDKILFGIILDSPRATRSPHWSWRYFLDSWGDYHFGKPPALFVDRNKPTNRYFFQLIQSFFVLIWSTNTSTITTKLIQIDLTVLILISRNMFCKAGKITGITGTNLICLSNFTGRQLWTGIFLHWLDNYSNAASGTQWYICRNIFAETFL